MTNPELSIKSEASVVLKRVSQFLSERDVRSYLVGGFVRDMLLGRKTADIDIAVKADALIVAAELADSLRGKYVPLDVENGVARVILDNEDGWWELDFTTVTGNLEQDLARRDFTIDAVAIDLKDINQDISQIPLLDPFHGLDDIKQRLVRAVNETVFDADAIRLMRAVRLAAELGFSINSETESLIRQKSDLVSGVAGERIREELLRLLDVPQKEWISYLDDLGLLTAIIPELADTKGVEQPREHYWDVFQHSLWTVAAVDFLLRRGEWDHTDEKALDVVPWSNKLADYFTQEVSHGSTRRLLLKMAALLHDIAKPQTKFIEDNGKMRFIGHAQEGAEVAAAIMARLRFSSREAKLVELMVEYHLRPVQLSNEGLPSNRAIYRYFRDTGEAGIDVLYLSLADHLAARGPYLMEDQWQEHSRMVEHVLTQSFEQENVVIPPRLIDGNDLINIFGMSPGPEVGEVLESVREAQAAGELSTKEEALSFIYQRLSDKVKRYG